MVCVGIANEVLVPLEFASPGALPPVSPVIVTAAQIHEELLLTIEPCPCEDDVAIREVRGNGESEGLFK